MPQTEQFSQTGYSVIRSVIPDKQHRFLFAYILDRYGSIAAPPGDEQVPETPFAYADFVSERLLEALQPSIEDRVGASLYPTYSYLRLYKHGDALKKHVDRPACEISATLCVGYEPDAPWPIWIGGRGSEAAVTLLAGDMMVYRGMDVPHWREPYAGGRLAQIFLHYVDRAGPNSDWKYDKRPRLGTPPGGCGKYSGLRADCND